MTIRDKKVEINYFQQGRGDTVLLFLHGWCIDGLYWKHQVDHFSKTYRAIAMELPGFGKSRADRTDWTVEEYARDVTAFLDAMDLRNVVLIGHSMAGEIILETALTNNPRILGLVGVDNFKLIDVAFTPDQIREMEEFFPRLEKDFKNVAPAYADWMLFHPTTTQEVKDRVMSDFASSDPVVGYETCLHQIHYSSGDAQRLEQLSYRLYLINSDAPPTNETGLKAHCKQGFQVEFLPATGHYPMIEKPAEFNRLLEKVLKAMN